VARHRRDAKHRRLSPWPAEALPPFHIAALARYIGSAEHKAYPSFAGAARLRSDAFKCDPKYRDPSAITTALQQAILRGWVGRFDGAFPQYVWGWLDGVLYEARLSNRVAGQYHAYGLEPMEYPEDPIGLGLLTASGEP
jgi:hypothetical protein